MQAPSFWLEDVGPVTPRAPLPGDTSADVVVVGAGFTGLWTTWYLLEADPELDVVVLEAEFAGFGASGRNGAWCSPTIGTSPAGLVRRAGADVARRTVEVLRDTVDEVGRAADSAGIAAQFRKGGLLRIARGRHELPAMRSTFAGYERLGLADDLELLDRAALARRVAVAGAEGALFDPHGAVLHPGHLVRGLADAVETRGARLYERTRVTDVQTGATPRAVTTDRGRVTADVVVLATEAWLAELPGHHRDVLPVYSLIVLTEPVPDDRWDAIGWRGHETLSSHRLTVDYLSRTLDGRILFGGRGAPYRYGSRIDPDLEHHAPTHGRLAASVREWFPALADVRITHRWGGALGMPRDWMPGFRYDRDAGLATAYGYTGQGVAASNLAGRVLAEWIVTGRTRFADLPMVGHAARRWEPEPLRWAAVRYLQGALARLDRRAERTGRAPTGRSLAERLIRH